MSSQNEAETFLTNNDDTIITTESNDDPKNTSIVDSMISNDTILLKGLNGLKHKNKNGSASSSSENILNINKSPKSLNGNKSPIMKVAGFFKSKERSSENTENSIRGSLQLSPLLSFRKSHSQSGSYSDCGDDIKYDDFERLNLFDNLNQIEYDEYIINKLSMILTFFLYVYYLDIYYSKEILILCILYMDIVLLY